MDIVGLLFLLFFLFALLGVSANFTLNNIRLIGWRLNVAPFVLGLILGVFTTLPELFIGINATLLDVGEISFGNLMGGHVVILGLIAGGYILISRVVKTQEIAGPYWFVILGAYILLPLFLSINGSISMSNGLILVALYALIANGLLNTRRKRAAFPKPGLSAATASRPAAKAILYSLLGIIGILVFSRFIIDTTLILAEELGIPLFVSGLVIFSIGTNLPELAVVVTAWRKKIKRLALGNLMGSSFTHSLVIGILAMIRPIFVPLNYSFWALFVSLTVLVILYVYFAISDGRFSRTEGVVLIGVYIFFILSQFVCQIFPGIQACSLP